MVLPDQLAVAPCSYSMSVQRFTTMTIVVLTNGGLLIDKSSLANTLSDLTECLIVSFKLSSKMNTSTTATTTLNRLTLPPNYCVLPAQHSHSFPSILLQDIALGGEDEDLILNGQVDIVNQYDRKLISQIIVSKEGDNNSNQAKKIKRSAGVSETGRENETLTLLYDIGYDEINPIAPAESILNHGKKIYANYHHQHNLPQIDPYIDAVQVKSRINNKRGARVKALGSPRDHEPKSSYYSKRVHVETSSKEEQNDWETDNDDLDDEDDHDYHYDTGDYKEGHYSGYGADKKHGKKKKVYKVKAYLGKGKKKRKKKKNNHYYYLHGSGKHGASGYGYADAGKYGNKHGSGKKGYKKRKKKKVYAPKKKKAYVYVYKEPKREHHYGYDHDHKHHDNGKYKYNHGADKYKMVHMDHHQLMEHHHKGGKMSIAGLLGYTLLCVNYLLVLKQPTYDKYNSHGYTKYSPHHHGKGELVHVKGGGPIILAHCAEFNEQSSSLLMKRFARSTTAETTTTNNNSTSEEYFVKKEQQLKKQSNASLESAESYHHQHDHHDDDHSSALYYLRNNARSSGAGSPPAYYYTLSPSYGSNQYSVGNQLNDHGYSHQSLLSPIQNYLDRLLIPTSVSGSDYNNNHYDHHNDDNHSYAPIRVVGSPRASLQTNRGINMAAIRSGGRVVIGPDVRSLGVNNARLMVVDGQPQVVKQRDNLIDLRSRQVDIQMHVIRRKFAGPQQMVNLPEEADFLLARRGNLGIQLPVAVRAPIGADEQMQADQPVFQQDNSNVNISSSSNGNNQILDLPEYALSGDSIELTCNHRIPISRLYSVKWFKDSLEFYRYIPANGARSKSSLFLPEIRLDLARSNSQVLYLRNVTHRTSGLYRCEVVSGK